MIETLITKVNEKDMSIIRNHNIEILSNTKVDYSNCVCLKPWGYEFLVYESDKLGIWYLNITKNNGTSLHTHFNKDTFIIVISGTAKITLIDNEIHILNTMSSIFIPKNKFHAVSSFSDEVFLLEIEIFDINASFSDKNDLLRIDDQYKRKNTGYESSIRTVTDFLDKYYYFNLIDNYERIFHDTYIKVTSNIYDIIGSNYIILLKGTMYLDNMYIKEGSRLNVNETSNIITSSNLFLSINNEYFKENSKIIHSMEQLRIIIKKLDSKKKVLTSGCFDILHVGHLHNLKVAKSLGDLLFVCLSNDEQIKKLKGDNRPINNYTDRINILKTLPYIDYVILYDESDIENESTLDAIMKEVSPYIWAKGDDYKVQSILDKHPHLNKIVLIENILGKSTTNIINKIAN
jgi:rfaE bifunctional protein nucleotidyltransferase chain/domain